MTPELERPNDLFDQLTLVHWYPVDDQFQEVELPAVGYSQGGAVRNVPAVGDIVCFSQENWEVVRRIWTTPVPHKDVLTPRQMCTLYIRKVEQLV